MKPKLSFLLVAFLFLLVPAFAVLPSQQYNKLFYTPYYVSNLTQNQNTTFSFTIDPPDGLESVKSAVLNFQVYASPTITFTLWVDGKQCSPPSFVISTTYAGASLLPFSFDCSDVVKTKGVHTAKLMPSKTTGAGYGWLDVTYTNKPTPDFSMFGTEYTANSLATIFLRLVDADSNPVDNAICILNVYAPYSYNISHPKLINNQIMLHKEEGLYYYDYLLPSYTGIYMELASCRYTQVLRDYPDGEISHFPDVTMAVGSELVGSPVTLNSYLDWLYMRVKSTPSKNFDLNFSFSNLDYNYTNASRVDLNIWGETPSAGDQFTMSAWNWTKGAWYVIGTYVGQGSSDGLYATGVDEYRSFQYPNDTNNFFVGQNAKVRINSTGSSGNSYTFFNSMYFTVSTHDTSTIPPEIRGSGEIHVSSPEVVTFPIVTLCGDQSSDCAEFITDYAEYPYLEGSIYDNVTVLADRSLNYEWVYTTPREVDCTAIYKLTVSNVSFNDPNATLLDPTTMKQDSTAGNENCVIHVPLNAVRGVTYYYRVWMGNYMKYVVNQNNDFTSKQNLTIRPSCDSLAQANSYYYDVPILNSTILPAGNEDPNVTLRLCNRMYDDFYWVSYYNTQAASITDAGTYASYLSESNYYREELASSITTLLNITALNALTNTNITSVLNSISIANQSIHSALASNFTQVATGQSQILGNLSSVLAAVQSTNTTIHNALYQNGSAILSAISGINASLHSALASNFTSVQVSISSVNSSILSALSTGLSNTNNLIIYANGTIHSALAGNFTNTNNLISALDGKVVSANLTIHSALASNFSLVRADIASVNNSVSLWLWGNFSNTNSLISALNSAMGANFTYTNSLIQNLNVSVNLTPVLNSIDYANTTIHSALSDVNSSLFGQGGIILNAVYSTQADVQSTNATIHSSLSESTTTILAALWGNFTQAFNDLFDINYNVVAANNSIHSNVNSQFDQLNTHLIGNFTEKDLAIESTNRTLHDALYANFTYTDSLINQTNISIYEHTPDINLTPVLNAIDSTNATLHSSITSESSTIQNLIIGTNSTLYNYLTAIGTYFDNLFTLHASTMEANFSYTNGLILGVNGTVGQCPSANNISNTVWNWPTRTLTGWDGVIHNFWNSNDNTCAPKATPPSDTVGNTPDEPAQSKIGNTEAGDECGVTCRLTGWVDGLFGGGTP